MHKKIVIVILFILSAVLITQAFATEDPSTPSNRSGQEFATSYDVIYDVSEDGITTVTEKVILRNLTSQYYATQFKITIGATDISDVVASDPAGVLETTVEKKDNTSILSVKFNQQVVGLNKELSWNLKFKSKDFATKVGKVWEVSIPKLFSISNLENYNLTLSVPESFGEPTLMSPPAKSQSVSFGRMVFTFEKDQLADFGVSASFGIIQLFNFDLAYNLENPNIVPILTNIALPPDTAFQDIIFQRIEPEPINVTVDEDGNYLAWYKLNRGERLTVRTIGSARIYSKSKIKNATLDPKLKDIYLKPQKYWEKDNPLITTKVSDILTSSENLPTKDKALLIHRFVVNYLKYDASRLSSNIERLGAVTALNNPDSAVCMEYTDLFIALARAAGIPARELNGYAFTSNTSLRPLSLNKDILHAWPEYFDEQIGWVMIDPTWESTSGGVDYFNKLDLSHFVFVVKGVSSENPVPAGSYKYLGQDSHDVKVTLSEVDFLGKAQLDVKIDTVGSILAGFPTKVRIRITNLGNTIQPSANFSIDSGQLKILDNQTTQTGPIPAFGFAEFEYNGRTSSLFDDFDGSIVINVSGQQFKKDIKVKPFIIFQTFPLALVSTILGIFILYFLILGGFIYKKRYIKRVVDVKVVYKKKRR